MHARFGRISFPPDRADDLVAHVRDNVIAPYRDRDGYKGFRLLVDRSGGRAMGVTFWDSEEHMHATDELAQQVRSGAADASGGTVEGVDFYEVVIDEIA
jgi:heme-degrading monooxygenase HmoA